MLTLQSRLSRILQTSTESESPIPDLGERELWVLRDDELGGMWGTKFRKYASIIEHCKTNNISDVIATGGVNSNNLAAAAIILKEHGIQLTAFAVQDHDDQQGKLSGNRMIIRTAIPSQHLKIVPRNEKQLIPSLMAEYAENLRIQHGKQSMVLEEGGGCSAAVAGCMTIADDIIRSRPEWPEGTIPAHIFIDSGTALSSASLAAALKIKKLDTKTKLHIIQMAGFEEQLEAAFNNWVEPETSIAWNDVKHFTRVYRPLSPRSYGATSAELFQFIRHMAQNHGLLLDPVYTAKSFMRAFDLIKGQNCKGRIVIIHTGGITGMMGYDIVNS